MYYSSNPPTNTCRVCMSKYQSSINNVANETTPLLFRPQVRRTRCTDKYGVLLLGILIFILFLGMTIGFYLLIVEQKEIEPAYVVSFSSRYNWRAAQVEKNEDLNAPSNKLILVFTHSPNCYNQHNCTKEMRRLQEESLQNNKSDLPYNFIVADDNRIYEGRGWQYAPDIKPYSDNSTLAIAFLGYPGKTELTSSQKDQLNILINLSISHHKLNRCFHVLTRIEEKPHLQEVADQIQDAFVNTACR